MVLLAKRVISLCKTQKAIPKIINHI